MRRQSRELALQILFQIEFSPSVSVPDLLQLVGGSVGRDALTYAEAIVSGVAQNRTAIDANIQSVSTHWKIERMSKVDRNLLRIAVFEMKFSGDPQDPGVAINEAVELAKKFSSNESGAFVNGVLDQIAKENRGSHA